MFVNKKLFSDQSLTSSSGSSSQVADPTQIAETHQPKENVTGSTLPMSIEVLAIIVVCGIAVLLIFVGVVYKLFCGKKEPVDEESCAGDDDHDEDDEAEKEHLDSTNSS